MSIDIRNNQTLLASLMTRHGQPAGAQPAGRLQSGVFAERLDHALETTEQAPAPQQLKGQALADTLSLQMLHATLSLGDSSAENTPPLFERQSPHFQSLVSAYAANQPEAGVQSAQQSEKPSQLQELAETAPARRLPDTGFQGIQGLETIITRASNRYGVDSGLIKAVIKAESGFNPNAVSPAGAQGLMQLMPGTARALGVNDSFDPEQNVMAGTRFLHDLLKRYNGNLDSALAAYNWGPGNVDKRPAQLPHETRDYLARVKQLYSSYTV